MQSRCKPRALSAVREADDVPADHGACVGVEQFYGVFRDYNCRVAETMVPRRPGLGGMQPDLGLMVVGLVGMGLLATADKRY